MRIIFLSLTDADFNADTPYSNPLGGTESAACFLAAALANLGHQTFIFSKTSAPGLHHGVTSLHWDNSYAAITNLQPDAVILLRIAAGLQMGRPLRPAKLVLWAQDDPLQPSVAPLKDLPERECYAGFAMVSHWQLNAYHKQFPLDPARIAILPNAISPTFENLFPNNQPILPAKSTPPLLAYASAPYRGLSILLDIFPKIRAAIPDARLRIHSSMKTHLLTNAQDQLQYGHLYQRCAQTPGVEYAGPVSQTELAATLKSAAALLYPCTFPETSCIAVMQAMAAGCSIITSQIGALPETTAGFAALIPTAGGVDAYKQQFTQAAIAALRPFQQPDRRPLENHLAHQIRYANTNSWRHRAQQWQSWLNTLTIPFSHYTAQANTITWNLNPKPKTP